MAWKKGETGNPLGRPKGKKDQFTSRFWHDLNHAWKENGAHALQQVIEHHPSKFVQICASVLPRDEQAREMKHAIEVTLREPEWLRLSDTPSPIDDTQAIDIIANKDDDVQD